MTAKKLITRTDYLLPESLEAGHRQSQEWLETVAFWKDEIRFLQNLLRKRLKVRGEHTEYPEMLENLDTLHEHLFDYLTSEILEHERLLSRAVRGEAGLADSDYRDAHRKLGAKLEVFRKDFRNFKRMVFGYARKW